MKTTALLLFILCAAALQGQSGRSYGPGQVWWDAGTGSALPWQEEYDDPSGLIGILNAKGLVRTSGHPFFEALGSNGRACVTCHQPSNAMGLSAAAAKARWTETNGKDPLFAAVDGANCPDLPQGEASSHSLLINRGLFRIALPWPPKQGAEFEIEVLRDPTGCNKSAAYGLKSASPSVSVYRRPRITANLRHVVSGPEGMNFMADAREPSLRNQAITAALVHEGAKEEPSDEQLRRIIEFESQVYAAQYSNLHGGLTGEQGGPALGREQLSAGDSGLPSPASFSTWQKAESHSGLQRDFRASVARGSALFSSNCASCHASGTTRWKDVGTTNVASAEAGAPDLPLFRVTCKSDATPHPALGRVIYTQDPGRALISGKCADVGSIVVPQFRGLAARAPYFSNGSATTVRDVVEFYNRRLGKAFSEQEKLDLANFLSVL